MKPPVITIRRVGFRYRLYYQPVSGVREQELLFRSFFYSSAKMVADAMEAAFADGIVCGENKLRTS